jgi:sulfur carrier protein
MNITLNGKEIVVNEPITLEQLLQTQNIAPEKDGIAVALNWEVIHKQKWHETQLKQGDVIEIVHAMQGG